jgi:hypothetical protein
MDYAETVDTKAMELGIQDVGTTTCERERPEGT